MIQKKTLASGAVVLSDEMPGLKTFSLAVSIASGSVLERPGEQGFAHLLEHMVFKGAGGRSAKALAEVIEAEGAQINAHTAHERTVFSVRGLEGSLPLALEVLSDLVFRPALEAEDLRREQDVVVQEIAEAYDTPDDHVFELAQAMAYGDHPLGAPILGSEASVRSARPETLEAFRRRHYAPHKMAISVAGQVNHEAFCELADRSFGQTPNVPAPETGAEDAIAAAVFRGGSTGLARRLEQANLVWYLPGVSSRDPDYFALRLFSEILGGGMASRLFQRAREERGLAYTIDAFSDHYDQSGLFGIFAGCSADQATDLAGLVAEEIRALVNDPHADELSRAKAQMRANLFMALESPAHRAERAGGQWLTFGHLLSDDEIEARLMAVTRDDLQRVGQSLLRPSASACAILGPKAALKAKSVFQEALFG